MAKTTTGIHILGEVYTDKSELLTKMTQVKESISAAVKNAGMHELGSYYHKFEGGGFTGAVCLAESHVALHTWPELGYLTLDVYLCNYSKDNSAGCRLIFDAVSKFFEPTEVVERVIHR